LSPSDLLLEVDAIIKVNRYKIEILYQSKLNLT